MIVYNNREKGNGKSCNMTALDAIRSSFERKRTAKDRTHIVRNVKSLRVAFSWAYLVIIHFKVYCVLLTELVNTNSKKKLFLHCHRFKS